jgi:hypothetical protein
MTTWKNLPAKTWNSPVWETLESTGGAVRVLVNGVGFEGRFVGHGQEHVTDEEGRARSTIVLAKGAQPSAYAENCRILQWGEGSSTWKNLVGRHVLSIAAGCSPAAPENDTYEKAVGNILRRPEIDVASVVKNELPKAVKFGSPSEQASLMACIMDNLTKTLRPFRPDEARYSCELVASVCGGDVETYLTAWRERSVALLRRRLV